MKSLVEASYIFALRAAGVVVFAAPDMAIGLDVAVRKGVAMTNAFECVQSSRDFAEGWLYGVWLYGAVWCTNTTVVWVYGVHTVCHHVSLMYGCPYSITAAHDGAMV